MVIVTENNCRRCCGPSGSGDDCIYPDGTCKPPCCCLPPEDPASCASSPICSDDYWGGSIPSNDQCCPLPPGQPQVTLPDDPALRFVHVIGSYFYSRKPASCLLTDRAYQSFTVDGLGAQLSTCTQVAHTIGVQSMRTATGNCPPIGQEVLTLGGGVRADYYVSGSFGQPSGGNLPGVSFFAVATCDNGVEWHATRTNTVGTWEVMASVQPAFVAQGVQAVKLIYVASKSNPPNLLIVELLVIGGPSVLCPGWTPCQDGGTFPGKGINDPCPPVPDPPPQPGIPPFPPPVEPGQDCPRECYGDFPNCFRPIPVQLPGGGNCTVPGPCGGLPLIGQGSCPVGCVEVNDKCFKVLQSTPLVLKPCNPLAPPGSICGEVYDTGSGLVVPATSLITPGTRIIAVPGSSPVGTSVGGGDGCGGCLTGGGM